jgi:phytoene dehydrogenase-like protein
MFDYIIVGGGITGLYCAHLLKRQDASVRIAILEKLQRIGGRIGTVRWHNTNITRGAGIVRVKKDRLLMSLADELGVPISPFKHHIKYAPATNFKGDSRQLLNSYLRALRKEIATSISKSESFEDYAQRVLGDAEYQRFKILNGYTDYTRADPRATLDDYDFDDNMPGNTFGSIEWNHLLESLVRHLESHGIEIRSGYPVNSIIRSDSGFLINDNLPCRKIIIATTILPARRLLRNILDRRTARLLSYVAPQPFLYIYAKVDKVRSARFVKEISSYTVALPPVQKIIPMNPEAGIYMLVYADNDSARIMKDIRSLHELEMVVKHCTGIPVKLLDMRKIYWSCGTHYYKPLASSGTDVRGLLEQVRHPADDIYILGEGLSMEQGWVEGALLSVKMTL